MRAFFTVVISLGILGWVSGGFERLVPDFWRLVDGPLPSASSVLRWTYWDWGSLCAIGFLEQFTKNCFIQPKNRHWGFTLAFTFGVAVLLIVLSFGTENWIVLGILLAAVPAGFWTLVITGLWLLAPTFMAIREGSVMMRAPYPVRSLARPARLALQVVFKGYRIAAYGILAVLLYDALLQLLPLLEKHVTRLRHQSKEQHQQRDQCCHRSRH
jgi:hypothetical protein